MLRRLGGVVLVIAVVIGFKVYNKQSTFKEVKARLVQVCENDQKCIAAVETHFKSCFDSSYSMGGRRRSSELRSTELVSCINQRAGANYFSVQPD